MTSASIVINQGALPAGVASRSRDDLVVGVLVQLTNSVDEGVRGWRWALLASPPGSVAVLSNPVAPNPTFTPDLVGTYRLSLQVDEGNSGQSDIRTAIVRDTDGLRVPAVGEDGESNYPLADGSLNTGGYGPDLQALLERARAAGVADFYMSLTFDAAQALTYLGMNGNNAISSTFQSFVQWLAPYDCEVVEVVLQNIEAAAYGNTIIGTHIDENVTPEDTDTQSLDQGDGAVTFTLGTAVTAGQRLTISMDAQFAGNDVVGHILIRAT